LIVVSSDLSHYLTYDQAQAMDRETATSMTASAHPGADKQSTTSAAGSPLPDAAATPVWRDGLPAWQPASADPPSSVGFSRSLCGRRRSRCRPPWPSRSTG
jgi:hypothetical protein